MECPFDVLTSAQTTYFIVVTFAVVVERLLSADRYSVARATFRVEYLKIRPNGMFTRIGELKFLLLAILLPELDLPFSQREFFGLAVITYFFSFFSFFFCCCFLAILHWFSLEDIG